MKIIASFLSAALACAPLSLARADIVQFQPWFTAAGTNCTSAMAVNYKDSGFPDSPFPSGNWVATQTSNGDYLHTVNIEVKTQLFARTSASCTVRVVLPPEANIGQGFYGSVAWFQGHNSNTVDYPMMGVRTAGNPNHFVIMLSGPGEDARPLMISDLTNQAALDMRFMVKWHSPDPVPTGLPNMVSGLGPNGDITALLSSPPNAQRISCNANPIFPGPCW